MNPTDPEPTWNPDAHLESVYRRGRQLRHRRFAGAAAVTAVTVLSTSR